MSSSIEKVAARLAAAQHGIVTRQQLRAAGIGVHVIDYRVKAGRMRPLHRGVYLVGPVAPPHAYEMAACLACGPRACLSHRSAGVLWQVLNARVRPSTPEVAISRGDRRHPGIHVYRLYTLRSDDLTRHHGIPVTTPVRTLYDLATVLRTRQLEQAVAEAIALRLTTMETVLAMARRHAGRPGATRLLATVWDGDPARARSELEERGLALFRRARLPTPKTNVPVAGHEVDFYWPREGLVLEMDGAAFHRSRRAFERDHQRDADLMAAGLRVMRITWRKITQEPEDVAARLGAALLRKAGGTAG